MLLRLFQPCSPTAGTLMAHRMSVVIIAICFVFATHANGNILTKPDTDSVSHLASTAIQLTSDLANTWKSMSTASPGHVGNECIMSLMQEVLLVEDGFGYVNNLVTLSYLIVHENDERVVLQHTKMGLDSLLHTIMSARNRTNEIAGLCQSFAIVSVKAQKVLDFLGDAVKILREIDNRIGRQTGGRE
jgi:uncharacterized protein YutE (UPF0331/DUF86 family)